MMRAVSSCKLAAGCVCGGACVREVYGVDKEEDGTKYGALRYTRWNCKPR